MGGIQGGREKPIEIILLSQVNQWKPINDLRDLHLEGTTQESLSFRGLHSYINLLISSPNDKNEQKDIYFLHKYASKCDLTIS